MSDPYVENLERNAFGATPPEEHKTHSFELVHATDLTAKPRDFNWLIKSYVERDNVLELFGAPESGKSLIAIEMAFCIACGIPWYNAKVKQGDVIYLAGEGFNGYSRRLKALEEKYGRKADGLILSKQPADLSDDEVMAEVRDAIAAVSSDPALIVIDTLNRNFGGGDENSTRDMTQVIANIDYYLRRNNQAVMIVHHSGHNDKDRSRGSSSLFAALDLQYKVNKTDQVVTFENTKAKDITRPKPLAFNICGVDTGWMSEDGGKITAPVLASTEYTKNAINTIRFSHTDNMALKALREANEIHGVSPTVAMKKSFGGLEGDHRTVVSLDEWRKKFYPLCDDDGKGAEAKKKAFQRTRKKLLEHGKIAGMDGFFWEIFQ